MHGCHGDRMLKIAGWRTGAVYCIDHRLTPSLIFNSKISPSNKTASLSIVSLQRMFFLCHGEMQVSVHTFLLPLFQSLKPPFGSYQLTRGGRSRKVYSQTFNFQTRASSEQRLVVSRPNKKWQNEGNSS